MNSNRTMLDSEQDAYIRSFTSPPAGGFGGYPGLGGDSFAELSQGIPQGFPQGVSGLPVPYEGGTALGTGASTGSGILNGLNFNQIKGFVERMGGVEGIVGTMTKVQKVMSSFQQMAPMLKVLFNSFTGGKAKTAEKFRYGKLPKRRRKRSTKPGANRRPYSKGKGLSTNKRITTNKTIGRRR
ncbi:aminotransferase [Paenibacillus eucommiae]|uniref:Tyrosine protein kinase n=1 Tax=Paenibacillus eucommiae TaxID=1355755 RepID=A0ABS4J7L6_9BACL|nr:aminotransferase [Paenibacillus eucommiae]MBP1995805.1 hypothetical protein [Paenibacillus eucommiae]